MAEDYSEIFTSFTDIFNSFSNFVNNVVFPQSAGIGGAFFVILMIVIVIAMGIVGWKMAKRKRY